MVFTQSAKLIAAYLYHLPTHMVRQLTQPQPRQSKSPQTRPTRPPTKCLQISVRTLEAGASIRILQLQGRLTVESYQKMIEVADDLAGVGINSVIMDLTEVNEISGSGLFALYSAALLLNGQTPPDPNNGWAAYHAMAEGMKTASQPGLKLVNPQPQVADYLNQVGFDRFLEIYPDLAQAYASIRR